MRKQIIAKQNTGLVVPAGIHRGDVAARLGIVQNVIMNQRCQMDHLDNCGQHLVIVADPAAGFGGQQQQHGSQALAAEPSRMLQDVADVRILAA